MAVMQSFDVTSGCDLQEVDNAVNQAVKEIGQRFDFKGLKVSLEFRRDENLLLLAAPDESHLRAMWDVLLGKMTRRGVPTKNLKAGTVHPAAGASVRMEVTLQQGVPTEISRAIVKAIKDAKLRKVQAAIQADQVRVSSPFRDELQEAIALLRGQDFGIELTFGNYRSQ